jgi:integrase/recombinase XerC
MSKENKSIKTHPDGERCCFVCRRRPLPAHETWWGASKRVCENAHCAEKAKTSDFGRYVGPKALRCSAHGCSAFVPEGMYQEESLACSSRCWLRIRESRRVDTCKCGCGRKLPRHGQVFFSRKCNGKYQRAICVDESCGPYRDDFEAYITGYAAVHYRNVDAVRFYLYPFFRYLNECGVSSLDAVTPGTITCYLTHLKSTVDRTRATYIAYVKTFFDWLILAGQIEKANPVIGGFHFPPKVHRLPRPFTKEELDFTWQLLQERGDAKLRLAVAIGEEAGLRIGEVCRLRVSDVRVREQRLFIRLPNKTNRERFAHFSIKTKRYLMDWLSERNADLGHDFLLYNQLGVPFSPGVLRCALKKVLCESFEGQRRNEAGFKTWSFHRLRHTMASNLIAGGATVITTMDQGGWTSYDSMAGYAKVDQGMVKREYQEVQRRLVEQKDVPRTRRLTPADVLARHQTEWPGRSALQVPEKCRAGT